MQLSAAAVAAAAVVVAEECLVIFRLDYYVHKAAEVRLFLGLGELFFFNHTDEPCIRGVLEKQQPESGGLGRGGYADQIRMSITLIAMLT